MVTHFFTQLEEIGKSVYISFIHSATHSLCQSVTIVESIRDIGDMANIGDKANIENIANMGYTTDMEI